MANTAIAFTPPEPNRVYGVTIAGVFYPEGTEPDADLIDDRKPSIMYGGDDDEQEIGDVFDMFIPCCPARPIGLTCEHVGIPPRCRHCGGR